MYVYTDYLPEPKLTIGWTTNGINEAGKVQIAGAEAVIIIRQLNTAPAGQASIKKRIFQYLDQKGVLKGTVVGTPD